MLEEGPQHILITGASGTIGGAAARALAFPGRAIALHFHRNETAARDLSQEIERRGAATHLLAADVRKTSEAARLVSESFERMGGLDTLVHAAASFEKLPLGTVTEDHWNAILDLDLKAAFFIGQEAGMRMQSQGGKMIFMSDVAGVKPYAGYLPYCIAKAGVDALVRGLAKSLAPKVLVNAVAPYVVTRPAGMSDRGWNDLLSKMPTRKASSPEEIAAVIRMLVEAGESITGQIIAVDGGRMLR